MCQLLAVSCNEPVNINFSFEGFRARGGLTDEHRDGWGIAFFRNDNVDIFIDDQPAAESALAEELKGIDIKAKTIIAHIRKATVGDVKLENCHPFKRELWGKTWLFCHNGDLKNFKPRLTNRFMPEGETDSELAFCYLLQKLQTKFGDHEPSTYELFSALEEFSRATEAFGIFNIILSNGELLFTYCSTSLAYVERQYPFSRVTLVDKDISLDLGRHNSKKDKMILIATKPITKNEEWKIYEPGDARIFSYGELLFINQYPASVTISGA